MNAEETQRLYHFFRIAGEYFSGFRSGAAYPDFSGGICTESSLDECSLQSGETAALRQTDSRILQPSGLLFQKTENLNSLYEKIRSCSACGLCSTRKNAVPGEGPLELSGLSGSIKVMVIGEAPGADEDSSGRPFVGAAGKLLDKMLEAIKLSRRTNCYIANVIKCRPPGNRDPQPHETAACRHFLEAQIDFLKPKLILILGRVAAKLILESEQGIGQLRGKFFEYKGIPLMPTYHPSALLRNESLKRPAWEDLKLFKNKLIELDGTL